VRIAVMKGEPSEELLELDTLGQAEPIARRLDASNAMFGR
jgi:hypothetical protein